ncbi:hypothetical protein [Neobacillus sp. SAB-20_R2A]|uniref:hypothetical protein n=1 Tax=Neobacillus sp. SAB-20_R2A TaxID=3120519 RepID=UPI003C6E7BA7
MSKLFNHFKVWALAFTMLAGVFGFTSAAAAQGPAVVINNFTCGVPEANGNIILTTDSHTVITNDANGNTILKCFYKQDPNSNPPQAIVSKGFLCGTFLGLTTDSKAVITPSGNIVLTCKITPNPTP